MATPIHVLRLSRDFRAIQKSPIPYIDTHPSPSNILDWPYLITGPPDTPFAGGQYYGHLRFPATFPYAAPSITITTPSGRFVTNSVICTTFTNLHPEEWNPAWTVETILMGFLSYMTGKESGAGALRHFSDDDKRKFASLSKRWNSLECLPFAADFPEAHAANLATEEFTEAERKTMSNAADEDTTVQVANEQETLLDNSYESHMNEDWDKFGSMEDDFDYYEDEEDDNEEDYETSDTEIENGSTV
jgi:ubiquitin-conjugating enzyme E2 J2